jgi:hypothetical protein
MPAITSHLRPLWRLRCRSGLRFRRRRGAGSRVRCQKAQTRRSPSSHCPLPVVVKPLVLQCCSHCWLRVATAWKPVDVDGCGWCAPGSWWLARRARAAERRRSPCGCGCWCWNGSTECREHGGTRTRRVGAWCTGAHGGGGGGGTGAKKWRWALGIAHGLTFCFFAAFGFRESAANP